MTSETAPPEMPTATRELLRRVQRMVPPMLDHFHKGQLGRVAVIGGSEDYTGAPYFSAMASARLGCDMSHIICTPGAAAVVKTYSPNLMVHPLMRQTPSQIGTHPNSDSSPKDHDTNPESIASRVSDMLSRLHVLVIGPGLGRDSLMQATVARVIRAARERGIPVVLDADALLVIQSDPSLVRGYKKAILTPNVVEFSRLCKALDIDEEAVTQKGGETGKVEALARALEGATVVQKGQSDYISDGNTTIVVDLEGGKKRSGGQGDTLTGSVATFLGWRKAYLDGLWDHGDETLAEDELVQLAAFGGCAITRECSRLAFAKKGRSLQASDLTDEVHNAFLNLFGGVDGDGSEAK